MANADILVIPKLLDGANATVMHELATKYRQYRLHALLSDPEAFGATYHDESQRGMEHWIGRLQNPKATHFVAVEHAADPDVSDPLARLASAKWLGFLVLLGPKNSTGSTSARADPFSVMTAAGADSEDGMNGSSLHYHLNGMFVLQEARGRGLARALMSYVLQHAQEQCKSVGKDFVCTLFVDEINTAAYQLYLQSGFVVVDRMVYGKKIVTDGKVSFEDRVALDLELRRLYEVVTE